MKSQKLTAFALAYLMSAAVCAGAAADYYSITVRLNNITEDNRQSVVFFGDYEPVQINSRTYVHSRGFAEAAGMIVGWDQENKTAFVKVQADPESYKPIERYAAAQFELLSDRAPGEPLNITVSLMLDNSQALLRYNYDIGGGHVAGLGKTIEMDGAATMIDDGVLMVPLRGMLEALGLTVEWSQEAMTVDVGIPGTAAVPDGLEITDRWIPENTYYTGNAQPDYVPDGSHEIGQYLGSFRVTKYCPCDICNGGWGSNTAWAGEIVPGRTVAINPLSSIPKLAWIYIDGIGWRRAEDTGGGVAVNQIDLAVSSHYEATHGNVDYHDVWLAK